MAKICRLKWLIIGVEIFWPRIAENINSGENNIVIAESNGWLFQRQ
jgi:hypothetical protein